MEEQCPREERNTDCWPIAGEPRWQVEVGDRTVLGAQRLGNNGEWTAESIGSEDQAFRGDHGGRDCRRRSVRFASPASRLARVDLHGTDVRGCYIAADTTRGSRRR